MMLPLEDTTNWTADDALAYLKKVLSPDWRLESRTTDDGWPCLVLTNEEGVQWEGEHPDPKILYLNALGWVSYRKRQYKVKNPVWQRRNEEVPLARPPVKEETPDPPDLDPDEVDAVYRSSR